MDDQRFSGLLSQLIPDENENSLEAGKEGSGEQNIRMAGLLKLVAGQAGGGAENEVNDFLNGRGELLETTRAAVARGGKSAASVVADFLEEKLHLSAPLAKIIAPLVVQLFPAIKQITGTETATKPKPRRKKKKEESSTKPKPKPKPKPSTRPHKPKPSSSTKPASGQKPKPSSSKPKKPKPSSAQSGRKRPKRTQEINAGEEA